VRGTKRIITALAIGWALVGASTAAADTKVSLTFDDNFADTLPAVQMLDEHDMQGTFYVIPGRVGNTASGYMTWAQVQSIFDRGNEIGGHTQNHLNLPTLPPAQQETEICGGRDSLRARGYPQVSFAYPFGAHDATSEGLVQECGYLSGRRVGGIGGDGEPKSDTIPPEDPMLVRTRGSIDVNDTLTEIMDWITDAEDDDAANGSADVWFTLVFHHLCDPLVTDCLASPAEDQYITPQDFEALLDWLQPRAATGTRVVPMAQVMDPTPPSGSQILCNGAPCQPGLYGPVSATFTGTDSGGSGLWGIRYTTDGSTPNGSSPLYIPGSSPAIDLSAGTTIRFRAEDNARNLETTVHSQTIAVATLSVLSRRFLANGTAKLTFQVNGPGTIVAVDASGAGSSAVAAKKRAPRIKRASKAVAQAGRVTLVIRASKAGKRILRRKGKLKVPVRVTFTPIGGSPTSQTVKVKLRLTRR
jgi:peptidoglycan/xylan/chitin deacetylase (PgdA/CDA1 family)